MNFDKSEQINELAKALCQFQSSCPNVDLNATVKVATKSGGSYTFEYATLPHIVETIKPHLKAAGLSYSQLVNGDGGVNTILMHDSGQYLSSYTNLQMNIGGLQDLGGKITYLKRYALTAILGITAENDDDANGASGNKSEKTEKTPTEKPWLNKGTEKYKEIYNAFLSGHERAVVSNVRKTWSVNTDVANSLELALKIGDAVRGKKTTLATVQKDFSVDTKDINHVIEYINGISATAN